MAKIDTRAPRTAMLRTFVRTYLANEGGVLHHQDAPAIEAFLDALQDKLDAFHATLTDPPGQIPIVTAYGDDRSRKVVSALIDKPEVLYGVLGILHNYNVAGPWECRKVRTTSTDLAKDLDSWFRIDARQGGEVVTLVPLVGDKWHIRFHGKIQAGDNEADDLTEAMAKADMFLGVSEGYILVPGWKPA